MTAADLSQQFHQMTEPFLLLSEIERHVRKLLDGKVSEDELTKARDPSDSGRDVQRVDDLTLGECIRLVERALTSGAGSGYLSSIARQLQTVYGESHAFGMTLCTSILIHWKKTPSSLQNSLVSSSS